MADADNSGGIDHAEFGTLYKEIQAGGMLTDWEGEPQTEAGALAELDRDGEEAMIMISFELCCCKPRQGESDRTGTATCVLCSR